MRALYLIPMAYVLYIQTRAMAYWFHLGLLVRAGLAGAIFAFLAIRMIRGLIRTPSDTDILFSLLAGFCILVSGV
jgi:hypothetical protein